VFGAAHPLTAHRLLRVATVRVGQGRTNEAGPLLAVVTDMLSPYPEDTGLHEAKFYLGLLQVREVGGLPGPGPNYRPTSPPPPTTLTTTRCLI